MVLSNNNFFFPILIFTIFFCFLEIISSDYSSAESINSNKDSIDTKINNPNKSIINAKDISVEIKITHQKESKSWTVKYILSKPVHGLFFQRGGNLFRSERWHPLDKNVEIKKTEKGEIIYSKEDKLLSEFELSFKTEIFNLQKDYELFFQYQDGSILLYTGHFNISTILDSKNLPDPNSKLKTAFTFIPDTSEKIYILGKLYDTSPVIWDKNVEDGTYVFFGDTKPVETDIMIGLFDNKLPVWAKEKFSDLIPKLFNYYETNLEFKPKNKEIIFFSHGQSENTTGLDYSGNVLPGLIQLEISGLKWENTSNEAQKMLLKFLGHEVSHLWNGHLFKYEDNTSWMHEGGAEIFAYTVLRDFALISDDEFYNSLTEKLNKCILGMESSKDFSLNDSSKKRRFENYYTCGAIIGLITDSAVKKANPKSNGILDFWKLLFKKASTNNNLYTQEMYYSLLLELTKNKKLVTGLRNLISVPNPNFAKSLSTLLTLAGLKVNIVKPSNYNLEQNTSFGVSAFKKLMANDCNNQISFYTNEDHLAFDGLKDCNTLKNPLKIDRIGIYNIFKEGAKAYTFMYNECNKKRAIKLGLYKSKEFLSVNCSKNISIKPTLYNITKDSNIICFERRMSLLSQKGEGYQLLIDELIKYPLKDEEKLFVSLCQTNATNIKNNDNNLLPIILHETIHFAGQIGKSVLKNISREKLAKNDGFYHYIFVDDKNLRTIKIKYVTTPSLQSILKKESKNKLSEFTKRLNKLQRFKTYKNNDLFQLLDEWNAYLQQANFELHIRDDKNKLLSEKKDIDDTMAALTEMNEMVDIYYLIIKDVDKKTYLMISKNKDLSSFINTIIEKQNKLISLNDSNLIFRPFMTLKLNIDPQQRYLQASALIKNIDIKIKSKKNFAIFLNKNFNIDEIKINGKKANFIFNFEGETAAYTENAKPIIIKELTDDIESIDITYQGYIKETIADINMITPDLIELASYSGFYPFNKSEFPDFNYRLELTISSDSEFHAITNGSLIEHNIDKQSNINKNTFIFESISEYKNNNDIPIVASPSLKTEILELDNLKLEMSYAPGDIDYAANKAIIEMKDAYNLFVKRFGKHGSTLSKNNNLVRFIYSPRKGWGYSRLPLFIIPGKATPYFSRLPIPFREEVQVVGMVHELAHFWWGVADTQTNYDWINEGFAEYSAFSFGVSQYGEDFRKKYIEMYLSDIKKAKKNEAIIETDRESPDRYVNWYEKSALLFHVFEIKYGTEKFHSVLSSMFDKFKNNKTATTEDFLKLIKEKMGSDAEQFLKSFLTSKGWSKEQIQELAKIGNF
ncbi:MAG: hypothetical protein HQK49_13750 [Oligoflexia bacterium]|nr:hypothetical protein [Oligoflexia bacterium]